MKKLSAFLVVLLLVFLAHQVKAQSNGYLLKVENLQKQKTVVTTQEKEALKIEIKGINQQLERGVISDEKAQQLKEEAAKRRALNIENRIAIIDNRIALLERNDGVVIDDTMVENDSLIEDQIRIGIDINGKPAEKFIFNTNNWKRDLKYDRRTYSDFVLAIGLNNALIEGQSFADSPYKIGGSRFFEMGWQWRTRVLKNSNFLRFNYGFSFQFNGIKPNDNQYFVETNGSTELQEFPIELDKSKLRMDNLVFPVHFEFGSSKVRETEKTIRYNIDKSFRVGIGGYGGFNIGTRQKLKYQENGKRIKDKFKRDYNMADLIYGLSGYVGFGGTQLYVKYDLNPIFRNATIEQRNISLGLRFDL